MLIELRDFTGQATQKQEEKEVCVRERKKDPFGFWDRKGDNHGIEG